MSPLGNTALVKTLRGELTADLRRLKSERGDLKLRAKFQSKFTIKRTWSENILEKVSAKIGVNLRLINLKGLPLVLCSTRLALSQFGLAAFCQLSFSLLWLITDS